jgi:ribosome-associated toxin RatA of RatAB toxin-antitoxin module
VLLAHSRERMYALVADIERYPEFLPWCGGASISAQPDGSVLATVQIDFRGLRQSFTTLNRNREPESINMELAKGPFRRLHGQWRFTALKQTACKVEFRLDYEFAAGLLGRALAPIFDHIAGSMVDAFVRRADTMASSVTEASDPQSGRPGLR